MSTWYVKAWTVVAAVLALLVVVALIQYASAKAAYRDDIGYANARGRLYSAAAGGHLSQPSVERKLGEDIRAYVRQHGGLNGFRGDSNSYGGISSAIGEDPFNGISCSECGALKPKWATSLERAALGQENITDLVDVPSKPTNWATKVMSLLLLWLFALPVLLLLPWITATRRRQQAAKTYSLEDKRLLTALDRQLEQGVQDPELLQLRSGLQEALHERATAGEDERNDMRIDRIKQEARDRLDALEAGNKYLERGS